MTNPNKAKGTAFETAVTRYLKANGTPTAHRVAQTGRDDSGDIHGTSPFVLQAKNYADIPTALRVGLAGAIKQAAIAGEPFGAAVIKRRNKPVADSYVVLDLATFARLLVGMRGDSLFRYDATFAYGYTDADLEEAGILPADPCWKPAHRPAGLPAPTTRRPKRDGRYLN